METFVEWMHRQARDRGWNDSQLAQHAGISQSYISKVVTGDRIPGVKLCLGLARAFGTDEREVMARAGIGIRRVDQDGLSDWIALGRQLTGEERAMLRSLLLGAIVQRKR